jgi:hypothetical protein
MAQPNPSFESQCQLLLVLDHNPAKIPNFQYWTDGTLDQDFKTD